MGGEPVIPGIIGWFNGAIDARFWKESMMKKLMVLALVSSAMVATPAAAADVDAIGQYALSAEVESYCVFGQDDNSWVNQNNVVVADGNHSQGFAGADGAVEFDIQAPDNTVQAASATYRIDNAVCNEAFNITVASNNGGLQTSASTNDDDFTDNVDYTARMTFDGDEGPTITVASGTQPLYNSSEAKAGPARLRLRVPASNDLLLEGSYEDILTMIMQPNA
jgi:hypothetical protein